MTRARARSARPPTPPAPAVVGEIDPIITAAARAFRGLTPDERAIAPTVTSRPCRICHGPVTVPAAAPARDKPVCDSCQDQTSLFDSDGAGLFGGAA